MSQPTTQNLTRNPGLPAPLRRFLATPFVSTLTSPHGVDRYLEAINPLWTVNEVRARIVAVDKKTSGSLTLTLRPNRNWQGFAAGQFVRLGVEIEGKRRVRCFSPANSVHAQDGLIELTMRVHSQGLVTQYLQAYARPGMVVHLSQADGSFALPAQRPARIVLISGGSGVTPVMSMLRTLLDEQHAGEITFLHYALSADDDIYRSELDALVAQHRNVKVVRAYTEQSDASELSGFFCREHLQQAAPDYAQAQTFLCGPPAMMKSVQQVFAAEGIADHLHLEHFTAAPLSAVPTAGAPAEGEVRFVRSERLAVNSGATLLDQAEAAGLKPESGCRMGICHACTCRKTAGKVRDIRNGQISEAGEEDIQLCISVPVGTVTLDI